MPDFKPMLAAKDASKIRFPVLASPKIDGVRAVIIEGRVLSRSLKPIPNPFVQRCFGTAVLNGFDGELVVGESTGRDENGDDVMQRTTSGVMAKTGLPNVAYHVFDLTNLDYGFESRFATLSRIVENLPFDRLVLVPHVLIHDQAELDAYEAKCLAEGYEGVMVRDPAGKYKHGRSTAKEGGLVKIKRFTDAEAVIIDFVEREHNDNEATVDELGHTKRSTHKAGKRPAGDLGAFVCHHSLTGQTFQVGTGFSAAQRKLFWEQRETMRGQICKYKSFEVTGVKDAPRFPIFVGIRSPFDLDDPGKP